MKDISPFPNKAGWPWTKPTELLPEQIADASKLPRISIVTPSYNQGQFIEETIRSVLLQGYPNLEYIIIDGGSTDNSVEIIKKYQQWLTYWVSEPDCGQAHAINKGIERATGEILAYLNSDDYYLPGTLSKVGQHFIQFPQTDFLHGRCRYVNEEGTKVGDQFGNISRFDEIIDLWDVWWKKRQFVQPEVFWTKRITEQIGLFREDLNYVMDYEYWCRIFRHGGSIGSLDTEIACFRFTPKQKSNQSKLVADELLQVVRPLIWSIDTPLSFKKRLELKGKWLYNSLFLNQIEASCKNKESKVIRWAKSGFLILMNSEILFAPHFRTRARQWLNTKLT